MDLKALLINKTVWTGVIVALALTIGLMCKYYVKSPAAKPIEVAAEKIIDKETGVEFDFDPSDTKLLDDKTKLLSELEAKVKNRTIGGDDGK
jgi:hypothetical protein